MKGKHHHGDKKHHRDEGGRIGLVASGNPDVLKEAKEKTSGNTEERKHGGKVKKHVGAAEGKMAKHRRDRKRASGGRVGSDKSPLSSAHHGGKAGERAGGHAD